MNDLKNKALFQDMRSQLTPDENVTLSVLRKARLAASQEGSKTGADIVDKNNGPAQLKSKWKYFAAAAACAAIAVGASAMLLRNADKLPADENSAAPGTSSLSAVLQPEGKVVGSGRCGEELTYELYENGVLTIGGNGDMYDFNFTDDGSSTDSPFYYYNNDIKSIVISDGAASIGDGAFYNLPYLTGISIPDSVTSIGDDAFLNCSALTGLVIPQGVTSIGRSAFADCRSLTVVQLPNGIKDIEDFTFANCTSLANVIIPTGVTSIGNDSFNSCTALKSISLINVRTIGDRAFYNCTSLESVHLSNNTVEIGESAFCNCTKLLKIRIPSSVTSIGDWAFGYYLSNEDDDTPTALGSFTVEANSDSAAKRYARDNGFDFVDAVFDDREPQHYNKVVAMGKCGDSINYTLYENGLLEITGEGKMYDYDYQPNIADEHELNSPFCADMNIKEVTISDGVTYIGSNMFVSCAGIQKVTLADSILIIGESAFYRCGSLESINIPSSTITIEADAFGFCTSLASVTLPEGLLNIRERAFESCELLTSIDIPRSVYGIGEDAFIRCSNIVSVTIPSGVTTIGNSAFQGCTKLKRVRIPSSVRWVGSYSFGYHFSYDPHPPKVEDFVIEGVPNSDAARYADDNRFEFVDIIANPQPEVQQPVTGKCGNDITYVLYGDGLLEITGTGYMYDYSYGSPFEKNTDIKKVVISEGVVNIGEAVFARCTSLSDITIPDSVTEIGKSAFSGCTSLADITISESVTSIGEAAFEDCVSLKSITLPENIDSIGFCAFGYYHTDSGYKKLAAFTIKGRAGSYAAREYAEEHGFAYVMIS